MAIYHFSVKVGRSGKSSALAHADYILRQNQYAERLETGKERLETALSGNMPEWATDPSTFWAASDTYERANGSVYREFEAALPRELTPEQRKKLVTDFIKQELGTTHAFSAAIHVPKDTDGNDQPHLHLMFSERQNDETDRTADQYFKRYNAKNPEKGGAKKGFQKKETNRSRDQQRTDLKELRTRWEIAVNSALEHAGKRERVTAKSHADRGITSPPEPKLGPNATAERRALVKERRIWRRKAAQKIVEANKIAARNMPTIRAEKAAQAAFDRQRERIASTPQHITGGLSFAALGLSIPTNQKPEQIKTAPEQKPELKQKPAPTPQQTIEKQLRDLTDNNPTYGFSAPTREFWNGNQTAKKPLAGITQDPATNAVTIDYAQLAADLATRSLEALKWVLAKLGAMQDMRKQLKRGFEELSTKKQPQTQTRRKQRGRDDFGM